MNKYENKYCIHDNNWNNNWRMNYVIYFYLKEKIQYNNNKNIEEI